MNHKPTDLPRGDRRTVRVNVAPIVSSPSTVMAVLLAAARTIQANGHYQGDYVPDVRDRELHVPHFLRPMSIVAAVKYAAAGDPHKDSLLADNALGVLALAIGDGPAWGDIFSLEAHIEDWGDEDGRSGDEVIALLERVATAPLERAA